MSAGDGKMNQLRALVCDDEAPLRDLMARRVEKLGLLVDKVSDGKAGMGLIASNKYDLIVTDIYMPEVTGLELLEAAKAQDRDIQVVIVTATATVENAIEAINLGAFCYLTKPFDHLSVFDNAILRAQELRRLTLNGKQAALAPGNGAEPAPKVNTASSNGESKELQELQELMAALPIGLVVVGDDGRVSLSTPLAKSWLEQEVRAGRRAIQRFLEHAKDQEGEVEEEVRLGQKLLHLSAAPAPGGDPRRKVVILQEKRNGTSPAKPGLTELVETATNLREGLLQLARLDLGEPALGIIRTMALEVADLERQAGVRSPLGKVASAPSRKPKVGVRPPSDKAKTPPPRPPAPPVPAPPAAFDQEDSDAAVDEAEPLLEQPESFEPQPEAIDDSGWQVPPEPAPASDEPPAQPFTTRLLQKGAEMLAKGAIPAAGATRFEAKADDDFADEVERQARQAVQGFISRVAEEEDFDAPPLEPVDLDAEPVEDELEDEALNEETLARLGAFASKPDERWRSGGSSEEEDES